MRAIAGIALVILIVLSSAASCVGSFYCYREHPIVAVLGGCSMGSSYTNTRSGHTYYRHSKPAKVRSSRSR